MTLAELHYAFKLNMDRVDKASSPDFNVAEIDWFLNEAQLHFINERLGKNPSYEATQKRIDDLSSLHIKPPLQPTIIPSLVSSGVFEVPLNSLASKYLRLLRISATIKDGSCFTPVILKFTQTDDMSEVLKDPFNKPAKDYVPYNFGRSSADNGSSIYIYSNNDISEVNIEYVKYPARVHFGNYVYIDGTNPPQHGLETPEHTHQEILDKACLIASLNIENPEYIQLKDRKITIHE